MRRRDFIAGIAGLAAGRAQAAHAQQSGKSARIGVFAAATNSIMGPAYRAFLDNLRRDGFIEGQNLIVDLKLSNQDLNALVAQAGDMAGANPDVLVTLGPEVVLRPWMNTSHSVPIVFVAINFDPIAGGYVQSLAKPAGNVTGVFLRQPELAEKQVELLTEAFPERTRLAILWDYISAPQFAAAERRAKLLRLHVHSRKLENVPYDFDLAVRNAIEAGANMLLVLSSPFFASQLDHLVQLTVRHHLPTMFVFKGYVEAGGLMSYGVDNVAMFRQGATFVAKILKGAKPHDLPVELPTKYEMVLNLKTAKAIGVELPTSILIRADQVIE